MESVLSDVDCLARSLSEPKAFEPIFDRHFVAVHRYLHRRAGRDLADELAAETFALAFVRRASCCASRSALPWLYGIATNLLRRRWRTERRQLRTYGRSGTDSWATYDDDPAASVGGSSVGARRAVHKLCRRESRQRNLLRGTRVRGFAADIPMPRNERRILALSANGSSPFA
jgi:DNA-directed RNA polymerase specialized sigma24 family protein